jgi:mono/diheme cytochrome c family protein
VVLGFNALQLSDDRDPLAPHAEALPAGSVTLRRLVESDRLEPARPDLVARPPRIRPRDPVARAALGYLVANCGSCHNGDGPLARLGLRLDHDTDGGEGMPEPAELSAVGVGGRWVVPSVPVELSRVVAPGEPDHSALAYRMASRRPASQMPPLGSVIVDEEGLNLVREWIAGLQLARSP